MNLCICPQTIIHPSLFTKITMLPNRWCEVLGRLESNASNVPALLNTFQTAIKVIFRTSEQTKTAEDQRKAKVQFQMADEKVKQKQTLVTQQLKQKTVAAGGGLSSKKTTKETMTADCAGWFNI